MLSNSNAAVNSMPCLQKPMIDGSITLIDTFVFPGYISKDRYYNGLWKNLSNDERSLTYFVPTLTSIPSCDIISAYKELRKRYSKNVNILKILYQI